MAAEAEVALDASDLVLRAIAPLCATGLSEDKAAYFEARVHTFLVSVVEMLMDRMPESPETMVLLWLTTLLGLPESAAQGVRNWVESNSSCVAHSKSDRADRPSSAPQVDETKRMELISKIPQFQTFDPDTLRDMCKATVAMRYTEHQEVQRVGVSGSGFHIVVSGQCKGFVLQERAVYTGGDVFGLDELTKGEPAAETVEVSRGTLTTLHLPAESFKELGLTKMLAGGPRKMKKAARARDNSHGVPTQDHPSSVPENTIDDHDKKLIAQAIQKNPNLAEVLDLSEAQADLICKGARIQEFAEGEVVFERGSYGDAFYVVQEGVFEVSAMEHVEESPEEGKGKKMDAAKFGSNVSVDDDKKGKVRLLRAGDSFGELALLYDSRRTATVRAMKKAAAWVITRTALRSVMKVDAEDRAAIHKALLDSVEGLAYLQDDDKLALSHALEERFFMKGDIVVRQGDQADSFYIIFDGECSVFENDNYICDLGRGKFFGDRALISNDVRTATVTVKSSACTLLVLDRESFNLILKAKQTGMACLGSRMKEQIQQDSRQRVPREQLEHIGLLGRGAFGFVSLERDAATGQLYALKAMSKAHIVKERLKDAVANEKICLDLLQSPFIVCLVSTYRDDKHIFLLLEVCSGGELFDLYAGCSDFFGSEPHARFYVACVTLALEHMHSRRVIYRDLKLENCLLTSNGYLKLTDMGLAKVVIGKTYTVCGTTDYFAPETLRQTGHNRAVDWWALGVMTFIVMSGRSPFDAPDAMSTYKKIIKGFAKVTFPESVSDNCARMILGLCQKKPEERMTMGSLGAQALKDDPWYEGFDWKAAQELRMAPPFDPAVTEDQVTAKSKRTVLEPLCELAYKDDGTGWDDIFDFNATPSPAQPS